MALPKLNDVPKYSVTIPSNQMEIQYRPFLVKEEKILLIAIESGDPKQMAISISDTVESCIYADGLEMKSLTGYDIEYLFLKIRSKSVGEVSTVNVSCTKCEEGNDYDINIDDIKVPENSVLNDTIKLTSDVSIKMKPPSYIKLAEDETLNDPDAPIADKIFRMVYETVDAVLTEDERISMKESSFKEFQEFIESMTTEQFNSVKEYVESMPTLRHPIDFECEHCGHENKVVLEGMQNFF